MSEKILINDMATMWIAGGGDEEGFVYCWIKIKEAIHDKQCEKFIESDKDD